MGIAVLFLVLALGVAAPASADPITISGSGDLDYSCCFASFGDPFTVSLSFETVSADQDVDPLRGYYSLGAGMISVRLGSYTFSAPSKASGTVWYDVASGTAGVEMVAQSLTPPYVTPPYPYPVPVSVLLGAERIDNVSDDSWPTTTDFVAALNATPFRNFQFFPLCEDCDRALATGNAVFTDGPAPVPEPATLLLLGTGLAGAVGRRWQQRKA